MTNQLAVFIDFENIALWAEQEFFDFEVTPFISYLQTRGPAVVKRAYGDWTRFARYRDELMNNSIDLIQIFSVRQGKNRADIRIAIDALEISMTHPQINTYVIVSGDSDFGPLAAKLREYGRYTLGVGPRSITHPLLVKSCDEFIYLETILGENTEASEQLTIDKEQARELLLRALQVHGSRGELPILGTRLKQTMLLMDPAFNEANFGYAQFKTWLEDSRDIIKLFVKDLQLFVAPLDYVATDQAEAPVSEPVAATGGDGGVPSSRPGLDVQYRQLFARMKMSTADVTTRRDVLRDIYREVNEHPGEYTADTLMDNLVSRYEAQGLSRSRNALKEIMQLGLHQRAFDYRKQTPSASAPLWLAPGINSEASFVTRAESDYVYDVIRAGLEVDLAEVACIVLNDRAQVEYIQNLVDDLKQRNLVSAKGKRYYLPGQGTIPFTDVPALQILYRDIAQIQVPDKMQANAETARMLSKKAMLQRSQDFSASGTTYLLACRLQWEAVEKGELGATLEDLRWYMASYASAMAGKLSQVNHDYSGARPYYLAFFSLVQEEDPLWGKMRGLINPMLAYYWVNAARELELNTSAWNLSLSSPTQIAIYTANHPNPELRKLWQKITMELAIVNPSLLRRVASQIKLNQSDWPESQRLAEQLESILATAIAG